MKRDNQLPSWLENPVKHLSQWPGSSSFSLQGQDSQRGWFPGDSESPPKAIRGSDTSTSQDSPESHLRVSIFCQAVGEVGTERALPNATFPGQHQDSVFHRLHLLLDFLHSCKEAVEAMTSLPWL